MLRYRTVALGEFPIRCGAAVLDRPPDLSPRLFFRWLHFALWVTAIELQPRTTWFVSQRRRVETTASFNP